jgi:DNA-binding PadR family transcriptional regulator
MSEDGPGNLLPLSQSVFHILLALADGEKHGYGIMLEIEQRTEGQVKLGPGTLYGAIKRLLAQGLIEEAGDFADADLDDERRRYYRITDFGMRVTHAEAQRLENLVRQAQLKRMLPQQYAGGKP